MADQKSAYSQASKNYVDFIVPASADDKGRFDRAKAREALFNENWKTHPVNLNEVVEKFCPNFTVKQKSDKLIFKGERYDISADMASGYLTIYDNKIKQWIRLDGSIAKNGNGHYKIKRREEM